MTAYSEYRKSPDASAVTVASSLDCGACCAGCCCFRSEDLDFEEWDEEVEVGLDEDDGLGWSDFFFDMNGVMSSSAGNEMKVEIFLSICGKVEVSLFYSH